MKDYEKAWNALETREKAIDAELRQPGISREWRSVLEAEKRKVRILKQRLRHEFKSDGGREYEAAKPKETSESKEPAPNNQDQAQTQQDKQGRDHLRDLEVQKWTQRQRD